MFVQVILGRAGDAEQLRRQCDGWAKSLAAGAEGWLGSTAGITPEGVFVLVARFESEAAARRNAARNEQGAWWTATENALAGEVEFHDSDAAAMTFGRPADDAGFVQVMRARVTDPARFVDIDHRAAKPFHRARPDLLGMLRAWHADGTLTAVDWFRSEAEARDGERREMPEQLKVLFDEWQHQLDDVHWFDLPEPWHASRTPHAT